MKPKVIVELGCYKGNSLNAFSQSVLEHNLDTKIYGIDMWQGDLHMGEFPEDIFIEVEGFFCRNYPSIVTLKKMSFNDAVNDFEDESIDLLHIDGLHTYEAVREDFETWLPKMSDHGVVLFHDTLVEKENFGVNKFWSEVSTQYPSYNFSFCHGLGVLLVGKQIPTKVEEVIEFAQLNSHFFESVFLSLCESSLSKNAFDFIIKLKLNSDEDESITPELIDAIRDGALSIENHDLNKAYLLMKYANALRPTGPFIKQKLLEYETKLTLK